jgi:hypothetical protein
MSAPSVMAQVLEVVDGLVEKLGEVSGGGHHQYTG